MISLPDERLTCDKPAASSSATTALALSGWPRHEDCQNIWSVMRQQFVGISNRHLFAGMSRQGQPRCALANLCLQCRNFRLIEGRRRGVGALDCQHRQRVGHPVDGSAEHQEMIEPSLLPVFRKCAATIRDVCASGLSDRSDMRALTRTCGMRRASSSSIVVGHNSDSANMARSGFQ